MQLHDILLLRFSVLRNYDTYHTANWYLLNSQYLYFTASQFISVEKTPTYSGGE